MKKNVFYVPILIILLIIFIPASVYSLYLHKTGAAINSSDGKLIIKDASGKNIGSYTCQSDVCFEMVSKVDDQYLKYNLGEKKKLGIVNGKYVFIFDNNLINLVNIANNEVIISFNSVKSYGYETDVFIVSDVDNKYGLYDVKNLTYLIEPKYDFMGTINTSDNLDINTFVVASNDNWYLIDYEENTLSILFTDPIYYYSDDYIVTISSDRYHIYYLYGNEYFTDTYITNIVVNGASIIIGDPTNNFKIYSDQDLVEEYQNVENPELKTNGDSVELYSNGTLLKSYNGS